LGRGGEEIDITLKAKMRRKALFLLDRNNLIHYNIHIMDLEKLNKTQIVLLVLLVSFVTSIATGIVTVTLMDQAPPAITHTINRVVEHTVEKVVPAKSQGAATVKTVIVKEESLVADAIQKNSGNIAEIFILKVPTSATVKTDENKELSLGEFVALGFMISKDGMIVADSALISNNGSYAVKTSDGVVRKVSLLTQDEEKGVALLAMYKDTENMVEFSAPPLADSDSVKLGQSVISINKNKELAVSTGIVSKLQNGQKVLPPENNTDEGASSQNLQNPEEEDPKMEFYLVSIYTTVVSPQSGSILLDMDGNIIGMNILREGIAFAVPSNTIKDMIILLQKKSEEKSPQNEAQG